MPHLTRRAVLAAALAAPTIRRAHAETSEVLIAKQFGTLYMQQDVMEHAEADRAARRPARPAEGWQADLRPARRDRPPSPTGCSRAHIHFASGGAPGALLLWDRTRGGIKSCFAMNATDQKLLTVRPDLRTIHDLAFRRTASRCPP